jgi:hypothetical protein
MFSMTDINVDGNQADYSFSQAGDDIAISEVGNPSNSTPLSAPSSVVFNDGTRRFAR